MSPFANHQSLPFSAARLCRVVLGFTALLLLGVVPAAAAEPQPGGLRGFTAEYRLSWHDMEFGKVDVSLNLDPQGGYRYSAHTVALGMLATIRDDVVDEVSEGRIEGGRVIPHLYSYLHSRPDGDRDIRLEFDWAAGRVINRINDSVWTMELPTGIQDKFSDDIALMLALKDGARELIEFGVADGGRLKRYRFQVVGRETVEGPIGVQPALVVTRAKGKREPNMRLWLGSDLNYLPLRAEKLDDGEAFLMYLQAVRWHD